MVLVKLKLTKPNKKVIEESVTGEIRWSTKVDKGKRHAFGIAFREVERHPKLRAYLQELEEMFRPT